MYVLAITGSIGSGKSSATRYLEQCGASVLDADLIAREVVTPGSPVLDELKDLFGNDIIDKTGALDRPVLAQCVFNDEMALERLNNVMIPAIYQELVRQLDELKCYLVSRERSCSCDSQTAIFAHRLIVIEIPLLAENPQFAVVADEVMVIETSYDVKIGRLLERGMTRVDIENRLAAQASDEERRSLADTVVVNDGSYEDLCAQLDEWLAQRAGGAHLGACDTSVSFDGACMGPSQGACDASVSMDGAQVELPHSQSNGTADLNGNQTRKGCE